MAPLTISLTAALSTMLRFASASHAWYEFPPAGNRSGGGGAQPTTFEALSSTLAWDRVEQTLHTFVYAATQFYFEHGCGAYFGGQHWGDGSSHVDFAIWDSNASSKSSQPAAANCQRFGNEGTGANCGAVVDFKRGREYSFHVELAMKNSSGAGWAVSIVDEWSGNETRYGQIFIRDVLGSRAAPDSVGGCGRLSTVAHVSPSVVPTAAAVGAISFQEYYLCDRLNWKETCGFHSSFGWLGPRFFSTSSSDSATSDLWLWEATADAGAAVRRARGPRANSTGATLPAAVMVDSENHTQTDGCVPGYPCGGARVYFQKGRDVAADPPLPQKRWIWKALKTTDDASRRIPGVFVSSADKSWLANLTRTIVAAGRIPTMHRGERISLFSPDDCTLWPNGSVVPPTGCAADPRGGCKAGSNCYADSYTRDSTYGVTLAPEFYSKAAVRVAAETFLNASQAGPGGLKMVEAILPGPPLCTPDFNCGLDNSFGCPDNNAFMLKLAAFYSTQWKDDAWLCAHEPELASVYTWARRLRGPEALSVGQYGFMDSVGVTGNNLFMSLLFVEGARAVATALSRAKCPAPLTVPVSNYTAEAERTSDAIGLLFDETVGMYKATDQHDNKTDVWGSVFAVSIGAGSAKHRAAVVDYVVANHSIVFAWGQVRHLPWPQSWTYARNLPGNGQNGGYWALPVSWALQAVAKKDPALANKLLGDCLADFRQNGVWEWANWTVPLPVGDEPGCPIGRCRAGHPNYVASATAVHSFVRDFANVQEEEPPLLKTDDAGQDHGAPAWRQSWAINDSTILMWRNATGYQPIDDFESYGVVMLDWAHGAHVWINSFSPSPMRNGAVLRHQCELIKARWPQKKCVVYRNSVKALSQFDDVSAKIDDPAFAGFFLPFKPGATQSGACRPNSGIGVDCANLTASDVHVPMCDPGALRTKCNRKLYHDSRQIPEVVGHNYRNDTIFAYENLSCTGSTCNCGESPCGEYLFDHRNASLRSWLAKEYFGGPDCLGSPAVDGIILDDNWSASGPSEEDIHSVADMGLSTKDVGDITAGLQQSLTALAAEAAKHGSYVVPSYAGDSMSTRSANHTQCAERMRQGCSPGAPPFGPFVFTVRGNAVPGGGWSPIDVELDLAYYLILRGPYAWIGSGYILGWGLSHSWNEATQRQLSISDFDGWLKDWGSRDFGLPKGQCTETAAGSEVFVREWSHVTATLDCKAPGGKPTGTVTMH